MWGSRQAGFRNSMVRSLLRQVRLAPHSIQRIKDLMKSCLISVLYTYYLLTHEARLADEAW
jgi:hypothetical protein